MKTEFFEIQNRAGKLKLNSGVFKESADKLIEEMDKLYGDKAVAAQMRIGEVVASADNSLESVTVEINSPGGSVFEGMRIYNALREMSERGVRVETVVDTIAASMGSVILMAGDERRMKTGSRIMIHEPSSIAMGDARQMRKSADLLESIANDLTEIYSERSGYDKDKIRSMMMDETWMDEDDAKEYGFINDLTDDVDNSLKSVSNSGMSIFASIFKNASSEQIEAAQAEVDRISVELVSITAERDAHVATITDQTATIAAHLETITAHEAAIAERDASITSMNDAITSRDQRIEDLTAEVEQAKASAGSQAITMLAGVGQTQPVEIEGGEEKSPQAIREEFAKMNPGKERSAFFAKHRKILSIKS